MNTDERFKDYNLIKFEKEFICAGVRENIISMYNFLAKRGANRSELDINNANMLISSKTPIVLLCYNTGTNYQFAAIRILKRSWWNYYHNKKINRNPKYKTFNLPSQWQDVLELCEFKEIELLIPEEA